MAEQTNARSNFLFTLALAVIAANVCWLVIRRRREDDMTSAPRPLVTPERREEDAAESSLRPQRLAEFIGQEQARANLGVFIAAATGGRKRSTTCCSSARPGSARPRWRRSWRASSASTFAPPRAR